MVFGNQLQHISNIAPELRGKMSWLIVQIEFSTKKKKKREADSLIRDALQIQDPVLMDDGKAEVGIRIRLVHGYVCCIPLSVDAINMRACLEKVHGCVLKSIL